MTTPLTPALLGYRMPAEWESHEATWLTWPRKDGISFPDKYELIPDYWVKMCKLLSPGEHVHINVFDDTQEEEIRRHLTEGGLEIGKRIHLHRFPAYEPWCRDHGPLFVTRDGNEGVKEKGYESNLAVVDWGYNAWGGKYPPFDLDDEVPVHVARYLELPLFQTRTVMEGGGLEVNGRGTLMTTESCLLNPNRNPKMSRNQIEQQLRDYLGVRHILWLGDGIEGDDTDGHIDDLTRFVDSNTVITMVEDDPSDPNHKPLEENLKKLKSMRDQDGELLRVIPIAMPGRVDYDGQRLPASYANFYIGNEVVLLPVFGDSKDANAIEILQGLFPSRKVEPIDCTDLIWGLGAFHCVTQQQPVTP